LPQVKRPDLLHSNIPTSDLNLLRSYCCVLHLNQHRCGGMLSLLMEKDSIPPYTWAWRTESSVVDKHAALEIKSQDSTKCRFRALEDILAPSRVHYKAGEDIALIQIKTCELLRNQEGICWSLWST